MPARPLFVTRKYPPSVGGMETLAAGVWRAVSAAAPDSKLLAYGGPNRGLPFWLPRAFARVITLLARSRVDLVLCGDALMYALLGPLLRAFRIEHATMVMGLDVTYANPLYRAVVHPLLRRAPSVIAISEATAEAARGYGVPADRITVVRLGIEVPDVVPEDRARARRELGERFDVPADAIVLLTLGRLVRRKGARWFVSQVLPRLPANVVYVVAGHGEEADPIRDAAATAGVTARVRVVGSVNDAWREALMRGADVFVQPNIRVDGDMEGFGLVTVEAAARGTLVVAAALEGILDAVVDGITGVLLPTEDADAWTKALSDLVAEPAKIAERGAVAAVATRERYGERAMAQALATVLRLDSGGSARPR